MPADWALSGFSFLRLRARDLWVLAEGVDWNVLTQEGAWINQSNDGLSGPTSMGCNVVSYVSDIIPGHQYVRIWLGVES